METIKILLPDEQWKEYKINCGFRDYEIIEITNPYIFHPNIIPYYYPLSNPHVVIFETITNYDVK